MPGIILGIIVWFLPDYKTILSPEEQINKGRLTREVGSLLKIKTLRVHWLASAFANLLIFGYISWLPAMLMRAYGVDVRQVGGLVGITIIVGLISAPIGGVQADKWQKHSDRGRLYFASLGFLIATLTHSAVYLSMGTALP